MNTVTSRDGTKIAYDRFGHGPALILVNGALGDRKLDRRIKLMSGIAGALARNYTVINYDRRGRGDSTEAGPFSVQREIEDIAALIDEFGGRAALFGFSSGGALALRAAGARIGVGRVAVYEAPFMVDAQDKRPPEDYGRRLDELVAAGDRSGAVKHFMRNAIGMPAPLVAAMRLTPMWKDMQASALTLPYDWAALGERNMRGDSLDPGEWATVTVPALVAYGAKSPSNLQKGARALADVLPNVELAVLEGIGHRLKVETLVPVLAGFLSRTAGDLQLMPSGALPPAA
jgi:pimeloyl-ACP methyl ester carboxylesterase